MQDKRNKATWQTKPCPAWCTQLHEDDDHPHDRFHDSEITKAPAVFAQRNHVAGSGHWTLIADEITIVTSQHDDSSSVVTFIGREEQISQSLTLTPESVGRLIEALTTHLAMLNGE